MENEILQIESNNKPLNEKTLSEKLIDLQVEWTNEIENLNSKMKNIPLLDELLTIIYTKRQKAVDLYFGMMKVLYDQTRNYKVKYASVYNNIKMGQNNIRYSNESSIQIQVESQLTHEKEIIDTITIFTNFMKESIQTIDNIIYGINNKIKIHELVNGIKSI